MSAGASPSTAAKSNVTASPWATSRSCAAACCSSRRTTPSSAYGTVHRNAIHCRRGIFSAWSNAWATASV